jgi:hypothetical protein
VPVAAPPDEHPYAEPPTRDGFAGGRRVQGGAAGGDQGGKNVAGWAALAVLIVLVFCGGGGWFLLAGKPGDNNGGVAAAPTTAPAPATSSPRPAPKPTKPKATAPAPAVKSHTLVCEEAVNKDANDVRIRLEQSNYTVKIINDQPGGKKGRVAAMSPCGVQPEGTEVTLRVFTGGQAQDPDPANSCDPFDPDSLASCAPRQ